LTRRAKPPLAAGAAQRRIDALERRSAAYAVRIAKAWRIGLEGAADRLGVRLPADLQAAGRGEIAPTPFGS
jgi:hypothetical protein